MPALLLTLPVRDPVATRDFFDHLGFRFDAEHSDRQSACMLVDRNIVVVFQADPDRTVAGVVACLTVDRPADVDRVVAAAADRGGRVHRSPGWRGGVYGGSFTDLDGHRWELFCPHP